MEVKHFCIGLVYLCKLSKFRLAFFVNSEFISEHRKTRKDHFLGWVNERILCQRFEAQIEPFFRRVANGHRVYQAS